MVPRTVVAFEGVNGAGKTRLIEAIRVTLQRVADNRVLTAKAAGLGEGPRMDCLRRILEYREDKLRRGQLTPKELSDYQRDRIFRLAYRHQLRRYLTSDTSRYTHVLLDRTPLMSWVYTSSVFPDSRHLEEVRKEALDSTAALALQRVYLLEVAPATVYGRVVARHAKANPAGHAVDMLVRMIPAPDDIVRRAREVAVASLADPRCTAKEWSLWDYMPYEDVLRQLEAYRTVVAEAANLLGFRWQSVDGERTTDSIADELVADLVAP